MSLDKLKELVRKKEFVMNELDNKLAEMTQEKENSVKAEV